jgi:Tol biopolymer transport system component
MQSNARYVPATRDHGAGILHVRDGVLLFQSFDGARLTGDPVSIAEGIEYLAGSTLGVFRVSDDGRTLTYSPEGADFNQLTVFDRAGNRSGTIGAAGTLGQPRFSLDRSKIAVNRPDRFAGTRDIWIVDGKTGAESRVTSNPANDWFPVWSPDGKGIAFGSDRSGGPGHHTYLKHALDSESAEVPLGGNNADDSYGAPYDWSRDGRWIALVYYDTKNLTDIRIARSNPPSKAMPYLATEFNEASPRFSPDGEWLAYVSDESGSTDVYVRPFRGTSYAPEGKIRVSSGGGDHPIWSAKGNELFFMAQNAVIHVADTSHLKDRHVVGRPEKLFQPCAATGIRFQVARFAPYAWHFDVAPDGRFVANCMAEPPGRYVVWMNWRAGDNTPSPEAASGLR